MSDRGYSLFWWGLITPQKMQAAYSQPHRQGRHCWLLCHRKCCNLVVFYGISIFVGYLMTIPIYIYKDGCCRSKERIRIYFKIGQSMKRFVFWNLFILFLQKCYIYVCFQLVAFVREHMWHKAILMGYSMRLELTLVSSINDPCLVRLVYIGVLVPLFWSVFTLVCFTRLWYFYSFVCVCVYVCVLELEWFWVSLTALCVCVCVCIMGGFVVLNLLIVLAPFFCICIHMSVYLCVCFQFFFHSSGDICVYGCACACVCIYHVYDL